METLSKAGNHLCGFRFPRCRGAKAGAVRVIGPAPLPTSPGQRTTDRGPLQPQARQDGETWPKGKAATLPRAWRRRGAMPAGAAKVHRPGPERVP